LLRVEDLLGIATADQARGYFTVSPNTSAPSMITGP